MNDMPVNPEAPRRSNTWIWIVAAVVLLCCCCIGAFVFYQYLGDPIMQALGITF